MIEYNVYIGYVNRPAAADHFTALGGYALGLGLPGFTSFDAVGGWRPPAGDEVYEPGKVFRFILDRPAQDMVMPWSVLAFVQEAKHLLQQQEVLVTRIEVGTWRT